MVALAGKKGVALQSYKSRILAAFKSRGELVCLANSLEVGVTNLRKFVYNTRSRKLGTHCRSTEAQRLAASERARISSRLHRRQDVIPCKRFVIIRRQELHDFFHIHRDIGSHDPKRGSLEKFWNLATQVKQAKDRAVGVRNTNRPSENLSTSARLALPATSFKKLEHIVDQEMEAEVSKKLEYCIDVCKLLPAHLGIPVEPFKPDNLIMLGKSMSNVTADDAVFSGRRLVLSLCLTAIMHTATLCSMVLL